MAKRPNLLGNLNLGSLDDNEEKKLEITPIENKEIVLSHFDFSYDIDDNLVSFLKDQTLKLHGTMSKAYTEVGKILAETQEKLSNNKNGVFEKWFVQMGFSKRTVYNLINRGTYIVQNLHNKNIVESLPLTLSYEITNPNCSQEIRDKVLSGEIKNLGEFIEAKKVLLSDSDEIQILEKKDLFATFENDFMKFDKSYKILNNILNEKARELSEDKQELVLKEIEYLTKRMEKLLKMI